MVVVAFKPTTTMATTICGKSYMMDRWVRTITTTTTTTTTNNNNTRTRIRSSSGIRGEGETRVKVTGMAESRSGSSCSSINGKVGERMSVGWRLMMSCAQFGGWDGKGLVRRNYWRGREKALSFGAKEEGFDDMEGSERKEDHRKKTKQINLPPSSPPRLLTLPTILTLGRVVAVPLLVTTFYMNSWWAPTVTTSIFIAAAITDWLDGYLARKMQLGTPFGAFLDPVADKLMVAATLVLLCTRPLEFPALGEVPWMLPIPAIAIIGREITMSAVREWAASQNSKVLEAVAVNNLGKWKTASQMAALSILLTTRDNSLIGSEVLVPLGVGLLYISAGLAVWSLVVYMKKIWRILLK